MTAMTDDADGYISRLDDPRRKAEAVQLDGIFRKATGFAPRLWSGKMIGYGVYDYTYASGRSGRWFATGFAVPARQITIYILPGYTPFEDLMARLGPHRRGKACLYVSRLEAIDTSVLGELIAAGLADLGTRWPVPADLGPLVIRLPERVRIRLCMI